MRSRTDSNIDRPARAIGPSVTLLLAGPAILLAAACSGTPGATGHGDVAHAPSTAGVLQTLTVDASAPALASMIRRSRDQAIADGVEPIPQHIRSRLAPFFPAKFLDDVRWTTSGFSFRLDTLLAGSLDYPGAVTFDNVIIFFDGEGVSDLALWLHELEHVRQYQEVGVDEFARLYVADWRRLEHETEAEAGRMMARIDMRHHRLQMAMRARQERAGPPPSERPVSPRPSSAT